MHNLSTVFKFEVLRTLKKKSFWLMALSFPIIIAVVFAIIFMSNQATSDAAEKMQDAKFSVKIQDDSGIIDQNLIAALEAEPVNDKQQGIDAVKSGHVDAFFYYPADTINERVEVYGRDISIFENSRYEAVAESLLNQSVNKQVSPETAAALQGNTSFSSTMFRGDQIYDSFKQMIAPGIFLVLFYFLIAMFGNQMLTSTIEEKENRVIEMILTTVEARTLIIGKILALIVLAFVQILIILLPSVIGYLVLKNSMDFAVIDSIDIASIPLDPVRITIAALIFASGFMLVTGLLVAIGAAAPTAKEANSFIGIVMMGLFAPLYAFTLFISVPESLIVKVLTLFPLTAPIPGLLRNAAGNLSPPESLIVIVILTVSAIVTLLAAVRIFRYGAIEYSKKISLKSLVNKRQRRSAK